MTQTADVDVNSASRNGALVPETVANGIDRSMVPVIMSEKNPVMITLKVLLRLLMILTPFLKKVYLSRNKNGIKERERTLKWH